MSIVQKLFKRIHKKHAAVVETAYEPYRQMLVDLVSNRDIDLATAEATLDQLGKSESDVEADVETMRKRIQSIGQLERSVEASINLQELEKERAVLAGEWERFHETIQPKFDDVNAKINAAQHAITAGQHAEQMLLRNVLDPSIIEREQVLKQEMDNISKLRAPLTKQLDGSNGSWVAGLDLTRTQIAKLKKASNSHGSNYESDQIDRLSVAEKTLAKNIAGFEKKRTALDQETAKIQVQFDELRHEKLTP